MDQLQELSRKRKEALGKMLSLNSKVYKAFLELEKAAYSDGTLTKKQKELIALDVMENVFDTE